MINLVPGFFLVKFFTLFSIMPGKEMYRSAKLKKKKNKMSTGAAKTEMHKVTCEDYETFTVASCPQLDS